MSSVMSARQEILEASAQHALPEGLKFDYGTAGFRMKAYGFRDPLAGRPRELDQLDAVVFRVGLLAALRSRKLNGQTVGVMITASHNPASDNGIKLVDPMGEMLESSWEAHATALANAQSDQDLLDTFSRLASEMRVKQDGIAKVIYARDTRSSGPALVRSLVDALQSTHAESTDYGILTTPQLHYLVRAINTQEMQYPYGDPTEQGYYEKMADAFTTAMKKRKTKGPVTVDCANGVGGPKLREFMKYLPDAAAGGVDIKVVNDDVASPEVLNVQCGADYVKTQQRGPASPRPGQLERWASLDGDADRIVYHFVDGDNQFRLLDGDRIATLAASFLADLGKQSGLAESLRIGVVQTAYANGASTEYITRMLKLPVMCTATGVKHLHHAAARFDVGVYFEANGHGTVLFSSHARTALRDAEPRSPAQQQALETLAAVAALANQATGDALADLLLVELILAHKGWGPREWELTYKDLPNRLVRVQVADRRLFRAVDAERRLESPSGAQAQIDAVVGRYKMGRAFARASGTEDVVRVYAEASTRGEADDLAQKVAEIVRLAGT